MMIVSKQVWLLAFIFVLESMQTSKFLVELRPKVVRDKAPKRNGEVCSGAIVSASFILGIDACMPHYKELEALVGLKGMHSATRTYEIIAVGGNQIKGHKLVVLYKTAKKIKFDERIEPIIVANIELPLGKHFMKHKFYHFQVGIDIVEIEIKLMPECNDLPPELYPGHDIACFDPADNPCWNSRGVPLTYNNTLLGFSRFCGYQCKEHEFLFVLLSKEYYEWVNRIINLPTGKRSATEL